MHLGLLLESESFPARFVGGLVQRRQISLPPFRCHFPLSLSRLPCFFSLTGPLLWRNTRTLLSRICTGAIDRRKLVLWGVFLAIYTFALGGWITFCTIHTNDGTLDFSRSGTWAPVHGLVRVLIGLTYYLLDPHLPSSWFAHYLFRALLAVGRRAV